MLIVLWEEGDLNSFFLNISLEVLFVVAKLHLMFISLVATSGDPIMVILQVHVQGL